MKVNSYESSEISFPSILRTIYFFKQGMLFFDGKDEIESSSIWIYYDSENKMYFKNCISRGEIVSKHEDEIKTTYEVKHVFGSLMIYELYK